MKPKLPKLLQDVVDAINETTDMTLEHPEVMRGPHTVRIDRSEYKGHRFVVHTCESAGDGGYASVVICKMYRNNTRETSFAFPTTPIVTLETYKTRQEAEEGHAAWIKRLETDPPAQLVEMSLTDGACELDERSGPEWRISELIV